MVVVPAGMGHINKRYLLGRLQRLGVASRAELAKSLGMSQPTAGKIADELLRIGVLEEVDLEEVVRHEGPASRKLRTRLGRPGRMLRLDQSTPRFLGIELGVYETSVALLPVGGQREDRWSHRVRTSGSAELWVRRLAKVTSNIKKGELWGVLVSVPGIVDEQTGRVLFSPNLHWTERSDLPRLLQQVWGAPVILVQEERVLALGQQFLGAKDEDFLLVDAGDGVGGAVIASGRLYATPLSFSGELGHTPVLGNKRRCGCGAVGCVETLLSRRGLLQSYAAAQPQSPATWAAMADDIRIRGVHPWLAVTLDATAGVIAGALNVLGLRRVIITGSLAELPTEVMTYLSKAIVKGAMWARFGKVEVSSAPRRRTAGLVAVGIDRLLLPMAAQEKSHSMAGAVSALR